jgi:hypothetical protein
MLKVEEQMEWVVYKKARREHPGTDATDRPVTQYSPALSVRCGGSGNTASHLDCRAATFEVTMTAEMPSVLR